MNYVGFDEKNGNIVVTLPETLVIDYRQLKKALQEAFFGEPENQQTAERMEVFIIKWLENHKME